MPCASFGREMTVISESTSTIAMKWDMDRQSCGEIRSFVIGYLPDRPDPYHRHQSRIPKWKILPD